MPVQVLLVVEHALFRESLVRVIEEAANLRVAGHGGSPEEVLTTLEGKPIDVIVVSLSQATASRLEMLRTHLGTERILVIADAEDADGCLLALEAGALGIVSRENSPDVFIRAIQLVASGSAWLDQDLLRWLAERRSRDVPVRFNLTLDAVEEGVLRGVCEGLTNGAIASGTGTSEGTVKAVLRRLYHRTGARTRSELVRLAMAEIGQPGGRP